MTQLEQYRDTWVAEKMDEVNKRTFIRKRTKRKL